MVTSIAAVLRNPDEWADNMFIAATNLLQSGASPGCMSRQTAAVFHHVLFHKEFLPNSIRIVLFGIDSRTTPSLRRKR